ncbi:DUF2306 domain-containing protein [Rossellomorea sp. y25]|uniref:DUF2306 domain-containing protein n=1 Tax=Rossellomorea sp. y25 TaxID=3118174 RepID=UPI002613DD53|nr:DUF2306 domain-containing protein [uncultured Rossellomorea sp.]
MRRVSFLFLLIIVLAWFGHTFSKNFIVDPDFSRFLEHKGSFELLENHLWTFFLRTHIILSLVALCAGPIALLKRSRKGTATLHKYAGRFYVLSIFLNAIPALYVSFYATGGWISFLGFLCLNVVWTGTTYLAYKKIRQGKVADHKRWMTRSYAVTLANTSIYILTLALNSGAGLDYIVSYQISVWIGWFLNLIIAEGIIKRRDDNRG